MSCNRKLSHKGTGICSQPQLQVLDLISTEKRAPVIVEGALCVRKFVRGGYHKAISEMDHSLPIFCVISNTEKPERKPSGILKAFLSQHPRQEGTTT